MNPTVDMLISPYDRANSRTDLPALVQLTHRRPQQWLPSRYNARMVAEDGRLMLWNTLNGTISVFKPEDREAVVAHLAPTGLQGPLDRYGKYLSRRGFLVESGVSEMDLFRLRYSREQWRTDTLQLILLASEDCNFRCTYCYEKFKAGTMAPQVRQGIMSMAMQRAPYLRELGVGWFGGEPLYGWEAVEELSPFFKDIADRHGISHSQNMTTNGYLLTEERATKLLSWGCRKYQITIDGLAEEHDCKRVGRDGSPTHAVILDNLRSMKARHDVFLVVIRVNFDQANVPRLGAFIEALSEDFGGDDRFQLRFRAVGKWGGDNDSNLSTCGVEEGEAVIQDLRARADAANMRKEAGGIRPMVSLGSQVCYAARPYNYIVGATGKLMKCTVVLDELEENVVGQLHPDGRMEVRDDRLLKWVAPHFESDSMCQKCYVLPVCQGSMCPLPRVTRNTRQCCHVKSHLKQEMRVTLAENDQRERSNVRVGVGG